MRAADRSSREPTSEALELCGRHSQRPLGIAITSERMAAAALTVRAVPAHRERRAGAVTERLVALHLFDGNVDPLRFQQRHGSLGEVRRSLGRAVTLIADHEGHLNEADVHRLPHLSDAVARGRDATHRRNRPSHARQLEAAPLSEARRVAGVLMVRAHEARDVNRSHSTVASHAMKIKLTAHASVRRSR